MPVEAKPLFRPDALRPHLVAFPCPDHIGEIRNTIGKWAEMFRSQRADQFKEKELLPRFLTDIFCTGLGYTEPADEAERFTFSRERHVEVDGKFADAVLGHFRPDGFTSVVALEGKGPLDPLDRPFAGRKKSAVEQGYGYAINLQCDWIIVTSMKQTRSAYPTSAKAKLPCLERGFSSTRHDRLSTRALPMTSAKIGLTAFAICKR